MSKNIKWRDLKFTEEINFNKTVVKSAIILRVKCTT